MRKYIAIALFLLLSSAAVQAQTTELTFSCNGTVKNGSLDPDPITNMVIVVNLRSDTVSGFNDIVANIYKIDDAGISFRGEGPLMVPGADGNLLSAGINYVSGSIDRITGDVEATTASNADARFKDISSLSNWQLTCKPTRR